MLISITQDHITNGKPGQPSDCPVALAFDLGRLSVFGSEIRCDGKAYLLPDHVQEFIKQFDAGLDVKPVSFEIDLDSPVMILENAAWRDV